MTGLRWILHQALTDRRGVIGSVLAGFAMVAAAIGLLATSAGLIARAALHPPLGDLRVAIVAIRLFGVTRPVFRYVERLVSHRAALRLLQRLRVWYFRALEPLAPARLIERRSGDLLARGVADIEELEQLPIRVLAPPAVALLVTILVTAFIGSYHATLGAMIFGFMIAGGVLAPVLTWQLGRSDGQTLVGARARLGAAVVESLQGAAELLAADRQHDTVARIDRLGRQVDALQARLTTVEAAGGAVLQAVSQMALWGLLVAAIPLVHAEALDGVTMTVILFAALAAFEALTPLAAAAAHARVQDETAERVLEIVDAEPAVRFDGKVELVGPATLRLEQVSFTYPGAAAPALQDIDLELAPGARLAVVGPSGSGKSTLARLLVRFWDPDTGQIRLGEHGLADLTDPALRQAVGLISQRTDLITGTIADNLRLARPDATDDDLWAALAQAGLDRFVAGLPAQLATFIGEQGANLSGGERQRLSIARALLRDSKILILDEPTAHLDAITAREVLDTILTAAADRTCLLITHDLDLAARLDGIALLEKGRIVAQGGHDQLLAESDTYRALWRLQRELIG